jgi:hypothetical protein
MNAAPRPNVSEAALAPPDPVPQGTLQAVAQGKSQVQDGQCTEKQIDVV